MPNRIVPPGLPEHLEYPRVPVGAVVLGAARRWGERVAFRRGAESITFAELGRAAARTANGLRARGVEPGDRVALRMPNRIAFPVAYYGVLLAGAAFVPVNPLLPEAAARAQIADSGAVLVLGEGDVAPLAEGMPDVPPRVEVDVDEHLAHLAYTGGTTGVSKGVLLPHSNVVTNLLQYCCWGTGSVPALDDEGGLRLEQVGSAEEWPARLGTGVVVNLTPWFHVMGTIAGMNAPVLTGATVVLHDRLDPAAYLAAVEEHRATTMGGAPALFAALAAHPDFDTRDLSSVLTISSGASPMPHDTAERLRARVPNAVVVEGYGLTEVTMGATGGPTWRSGVRKLGSVGLPTFDTEVRVVPVDGGDPLPPGEPGEVCLRGPQVMRGYHNHPEATAEVLVDGWLHTGDIGVLDEDGYLFIVDRKKDMLLYKGYNVYPRELEELLVAHPAVHGAAVVGRPHPTAGELPVAFVVPAQASLTPQQLQDDINANLVPYKRLREVHFVDAIPYSAAGKILKRELRNRLTAG
ncbi:class I adenylate-forming enzyme family protein [Actinokineospora bangkokensis]|uniref:Acyl-CoA synthetase n=1 Tax=Actinokineospora bangkokensis TaxID=1193682 RepID=A0A1Q9LG95_9PSEU|nr:AMP-binding protein [Actinokineospora bangkokensis]OLR91067.1 acyl-CoA synthetase [Actinokineospora bangkokensis]OLR92638.1 acyl-CoA synthetase [Actinokineospora bangkokensis]